MDAPVVKLIGCDIASDAWLMHATYDMHTDAHTSYQIHVLNDMLVVHM